MGVTKPKYLLVFICIYLFTLNLNAQIVADTFYIPNYPIPNLYFTDSAPELPDNVWNHKLEYFPQEFYNQIDLPNCGQASGLYNCLTYEFNRLLNRQADSNTIFAPTHTFNFQNGGNGWYGVSTFDSWNVVMSQGNMMMSDYNELPYISYEIEEKYRGQFWQDGYDNYYAGMKNRISAYYSLDTKTDEDLKILMHYFDDHLKGEIHGGTATFYGNSSFMHGEYNEIIDTINDLDFNPDQGKTMIIGKMYGNPTHSMTLAGYYKNNVIDFNNDGYITDTIDINEDGVVDMHDNETTLWIIINSYGGYDWHTSHFLFKYDLLPKVWNEQVFIPVPDTSYYPELTFKIKLKHPNRRDVKISAGISSDLNSEIPEQILEFPIWNYQGGEHGMKGVDTMPKPNTLEFGIDISDIKKFTNGEDTYKIFLKLENSGIYDSELQYFSIIDYSSENGDAHTIIEQPTAIHPASENYYSGIFNIKSNSNNSQLSVSIPPESKIGNMNVDIEIPVIPNNGNEPYEFYIINNNEYSVTLSYEDYPYGLYLESASFISEYNPEIINPEWSIPFADNYWDYISVEQSGTIAINHTLKFRNEYPYRTKKKNTNYLQINPYLITSHSETSRNISYLLRDTAIMIREQNCIFYGWDEFICTHDYFAKITPNGEIKIAYCDGTPQNLKFANLKTNTSKYYIPYDQTISDTFNTVTFTPYTPDSTFTINENGTLTMQAVSESGIYETYVLVRDANGDEFTKRIEVHVIGENIIGSFYPNPVIDIASYEIHAETDGVALIEIFNISGQQVSKFEQEITPGINNLCFNVKQYSINEGTYICKVSYDGKEETVKFVVVE